ncbi:MAG: DUF5591 domain-containing protein [Thermoanaerobaculia bacterium]
MIRPVRLEQLDRLLELADLLLLRSLSTALLVPKHAFGGARRAEEYRKRLRTLLVEENRVERALQHLVGHPEDELIPLERWRLGELVGASDRLLHHEHFRVGRERIAERFDPGDARTCLFLPCHRVKPYSQSPVVKAVQGLIERCGWARSVVIVVASVPGVVPIGMDRFYPFAYYNWSPADEEGRLIRSYVEALRERVGNFIDAFRGRFNRYIAYFRPASVEIDSIQGAFAERGLSCLQVPQAARMHEIVRKNRALWRFQGLKREECLAELGDALKGEEA